MDYELREDQKQYVDMEGGLKRIRGNQGLYIRMLNMFLSSKEFQELEDYLSQQEYQKASETAHAIKGITGNLSFPLLFETSAELMNQLREGKPQEESLTIYRSALAETLEIVKEIIASAN